MSKDLGDGVLYHAEMELHPVEKVRGSQTIPVNNKSGSLGESTAAAFVSLIFSLNYKKRSPDCSG